MLKQQCLHAKTYQTIRKSIIDIFKNISVIDRLKRKDQLFDSIKYITVFVNYLIIITVSNIISLNIQH